jgi:hypothetical protein
MEQIELLKDDDAAGDNTHVLGNHIALQFIGANKTTVALFHHNKPLKAVDLTDGVAKRLLVVELVELGAIQSRIATTLDISRQTIHNYIQTKKHFGMEGLINSYSPGRSESMRKQREDNRNKRLVGNKARLLEEMRREEKEKRDGNQPLLPFGEQTHSIAPEEQPFAEQNDWEQTRYAGVFAYLMTLIHLNDWLRMVTSYFGNKYRIFMVFILMVARGVRSIEQIKNIRKREAGLILGIRRLPTKLHTRIWLHGTCRMQASGHLLKDFFHRQVRNGLVGLWLWFTDGHLLPYTGKSKVHSGYSTQRQLMVPGRTNRVTCDISGRVVDFQIQEGKGDLRAYLLELRNKWSKDIEEMPVVVFDREGYGAEFFFDMNNAGIDFVTWDKHVDTQKLDALDADRFKEEFEVNGKQYRVFEDEKVFTHSLENKAEDSFSLRRVNIWNVTGNRRTSALANVSAEKMSAAQCAVAILNRWGASENTFKHLSDKHPLNYQPGYEFVKSEKQEIANPEIDEIKRQLKQKMKNLNKLCKKLSKNEQTFNKDGSVRVNSVHQRLRSQIQRVETEIDQLKQTSKALPERIDISSLEDYNCFQKICDESKNLFDFVTSSVWNARKQMTEWLLPFYENKNETVDLFYAITNCHGWIKSDAQKVTVRLEALEQPSRRAAQIQLCRKLTELGVTTPAGKLLKIEVGASPIK